MSIASVNATYQSAIYGEQGGGTIRVRDAGRIVSEDELWGNCPALNHLLNPTLGAMLIEDWFSYDAAATSGDYVLTQATAGTGAISSAATGVLELDCNSTTSGQGAQLQRSKAAFVPVAGKKLWFEAKVKIVDTFDKVQFFVGLAEVDTSIISSGAISTANHIGFYGATGSAGVLAMVGSKASSGGSVAAAKTLVEDTYVTLGFLVDGVTSITGYVDGVAVSTAFATADVPIVALYPSFVCQSDGTNDPIMHIAGYRVYQER